MRPIGASLADWCPVVPPRRGGAAHLIGMDTNTALSGLEELSEYLDVPVKTLYEWHQSGKGPAAVRVGRRLRYLLCDVRSWLDGQRTHLAEERAEGR
jgi:predicted DNA-binding transcriptional regulator AlpA